MLGRNAVQGVFGARCDCGEGFVNGRLELVVKLESLKIANLLIGYFLDADAQTNTIVYTKP